MKIPLLPNNVGKKRVNDAGPKQGHDRHDKMGILLLHREMEGKTWTTHGLRNL